MAYPATANHATVPGWRIWRSDAGRWWATRHQPFPKAAEAIGAARTVDQLREVIAEQERLAANAQGGTR
ncbi:hypothetical protein [Thermobispora bispora]|uniref:Uncharacterized protein n=1 Tax=Thermobispora bispora (strain ATCC 19993 / DSM 43833 / CBS 139.67 / JCM 10125 / KCTC 9307 / NBRC 14880 / R51) TaxID=469371 RepID=D6YA94_THEBD|nr:hypothetical protein [Thermobispora bispora]ADG88237.1 hypothetical protein Tbis_1520 [Thermobispora bispora DSM 43833]